MGLLLEMPHYPRIPIGEEVEVSGIVYINEEWETPKPGKVVGIALEMKEDATVEMSYHVVLEDGTHCYSLEERLNVPLEC